jgi:NADH:ubiquinone oxidoreductase subunit H
MAVLLRLFLGGWGDFREVGLGLNYLTFVRFGLVKINILNVYYVWTRWGVGVNESRK